MILRRFVAVADALAWLLQVIAEIALVVLLALVAHEVFVRYALNAPTQFSVEYSEYLLVLLTFASAAWVLREDSHVRVRLVLDRMPPRLQAVADLLGYGLLLVFCAVLVWQGMGLAQTALAGGDRSSSLIAFPLWIPYAFIPVGGLALALQCAAHCGRAWARIRRPQE